MGETGGNGEVGYKQPPRHTRFRPGRSGNPSGRPKREPNFRATLLAELAATMPAKGQKQAGSKLQALVQALVNSAITGNARAQSLLIGALLRIGEVEQNQAASVTSGDQAILDAYEGELKHGGTDETDTVSPQDEGNAA
jgi:hypothetical protein